MEQQDKPDWENGGEWDAEAADLMIGCSVLIGLTNLSSDEVVAQRQMHGVIVSASAKDGFEIALKGLHAGETFWLPPDPDGFQPAEPGPYQLRSTGETLQNPDYVSTWTIRDGKQ